MANNQKTVLITGGCGFLGSHLAESHLRSGDNVIVVDNFCTSSGKNEPYLRELSAELGGDSLIVVEADVTEGWVSWTEPLPEDWLESLKYVYHFASPASPPLYQELAFETMWVNTIGLSNAMNWADKHGARCIFASTSEIYGDPNVHPQPESYWGNVNTLGPRSCYDEAKRFGESLLYTHNWKKETKHGLVRIFNTYGPRMNPQDGRVVINFLVQALKGEDLSIFGDGSQTRSFCYVTDLIAAIRKYAESDLTTPINTGNPNEFTILELAEKVRGLFPEKKLGMSYHDFPQDDPKQRCPDITLAKTKLGWQPKIELVEGLGKMADWLKQMKI
ncbi:NAD-dependent epimerase/dehydratase family protein [bacterium]|nr:NAD-dependent epimerase/dehydratase family protein [bacterium]